jgi:Tfp pilus assembly protein PilO
MFSLKNIAIIFLLIALVVSAILVWPKYQETKSLTSKIEEVDFAIKNQEDYFLYLVDLGDKIEKDYKDKITFIDYALPRDSNLPLLFYFMIKTCSQNGLILTGISTNASEPSEDQKQGIITINLGVSGSYTSFKNFVSTLENSARLFNIESVNFSSPQKKDEPFNFSLNVKTQFIK